MIKVLKNKNSKYLQKKAEKRSITSRSKNKYKDKKVLIPASELEQLKKDILKLKAEIKIEKSFYVTTIKNRKDSGMFGIIISFSLAVTTIFIFPTDIILLILLPLIFLLFGSVFWLSSAYLFEEAGNRFLTIIYKVNKIGGFRIPFDRKWRAQWKLRKISSIYGFALIIESLSIPMLIIGIIILLIGLRSKSII